MLNTHNYFSIYTFLCLLYTCILSQEDCGLTFNSAPLCLNHHINATNNENAYICAKLTNKNNTTKTFCKKLGSKGYKKIDFGGDETKLKGEMTIDEENYI